jgi:hypothetical protein
MKILQMENVLLIFQSVLLWLSCHTIRTVPASFMALFRTYYPTTVISSRLRVQL